MAEDDVPTGPVPAGLKDLEQRVRQARERSESTGWKRPAGPSADAGNRGALSLALRMGTEMLAALVIGVGGGLLIDSWLGSRPWGLIIGFFIGAAAGVSNVYRAVGGLGYATGYRLRAKDSSPLPGTSGEQTQQKEKEQ